MISALSSPGLIVEVRGYSLTIQKESDHEN